VGERLQRTVPADAEVLFVHEGVVEADWKEDSHSLGAGDTWSVPPHLRYSLAAGDAGATLFIVNRA
jgi:hypothetical protein